MRSGRFALHRAVLVQIDQAYLSSARSWREPSGAGHVRLDALGLCVSMRHARKVQGGVEVAVLNVPAGIVVTEKSQLRYRPPVVQVDSLTNARPWLNQNRDAPQQASRNSACTVVGARAKRNAC
jgi:hypothetical protein